MDEQNQERARQEKAERDDLELDIEAGTQRNPDFPRTLAEAQRARA